MPDPQQFEHVCLACRIQLRIELVPTFEVRRLGERPDRRWRGLHASALHDRIYGAPRRFARSFHGRQIRVGAHVVASEHKVGDLGRGVGTHGPRTRRVDQEPGVVRWRRAGSVVEVGIEVERVHQRIAYYEIARRMAIERRLQLPPDLFSNLRRRALFGWLANEIADGLSTDRSTSRWSVRP